MAVISRIKIKNFKCFGEEFFELRLKNTLNIIVGNNEEGKSTIIEAIHAGLTTMYHGRSIKQQLSQYLFNKESVEKYIEAVNQGLEIVPPEIVIEIWFENDCNTVRYEGNDNSERANGHAGVKLEIKPDEELVDDFVKYVQENRPLRELPIEYYSVKWWSFARERLSINSQSVKSIMVDSSNYLLQNGSDLFISHILRETLDADDKIKISQAYRKMQAVFEDEEIILNINQKLIDTPSSISDNISIGINKGVSGEWDKSMLMHIDNLPFHNKGRGKQCICKTLLALSKESAKRASVVLLEEPENHLTFSSLGKLIDSISNSCNDKQIIITTHSSYVANKLGLDSLIFLKNGKCSKFDDIKEETSNFFRTIPGYDTLRFILCNACILVEGDADELIVQKAYMQEHQGKLPIADGIDVISVGGSAKRYLEIAERLSQRIAVLIDTDGDIQAVEKRYKDYLGSESIKICYSPYDDKHECKIDGKDFNDWTLEPELIRANTEKSMANLLSGLFCEDRYPNLTLSDSLRVYMRNHKTKCALRLFNTKEAIAIPQYIQQAIDYVKQ